MLYAAKCYWPGVSESELEQVAARALQASAEPDRIDVEYRGSLLFASDDLVLCLFEGPSRNAVKRASERVGIPCERVMDSVWLEPGTSPSEATDALKGRVCLTHTEGSVRRSRFS